MEADKVVLGVEWGYSLSAYKKGNQQDEDEEVRVCYVGITRAKFDLNLSYATSKKKKTNVIFLSQFALRLELQ